MRISKDKSLKHRSAAQNSCDFLESAGFNVIASESDAKNRMEFIEEYPAAFPASKFQEQVSNYAMYTLGPGQLNDQARLLAYGEKTLAANPNSLPALLLMAGSYIDDAKAGRACQCNILFAESNYGGKRGRAGCGQVAQTFSGSSALDCGIRIHQARQNGGGDSGVAVSNGTFEGTRRSGVRCWAITGWVLLMRSSTG